jgi:hypothetical protein
MARSLLSIFWENSGAAAWQEAWQDATRMWFGDKRTPDPSGRMLIRHSSIHCVRHITHLSFMLRQ